MVAVPFSSLACLAALLVRQWFIVYGNYARLTSSFNHLRHVRVAARSYLCSSYPRHLWRSGWRREWLNITQCTRSHWFRGSIRDITDDTNAGRAYAVLGFSWGFGGVIGPIFGGVFESPAVNFTGSFLGRIKLFQTFPYLLPTLLAGLVLVTGAILACFLSWDGGVRGGSRIALPVEKNEPLAPHAPSPAPAIPSPPIQPQPDTVRGRRPSYLSPALQEHEQSTSPSRRRDSRASLGTAYGYGGIRSKHPTLAARAALEAARRVSAAPRPPPDDDEFEEGEGEQARSLNFARRLLLANEENTFNINDLWVSAAVAQDNAVFEDDDEEEAEDEDEEEERTPQPSSNVATPLSDLPATIASRRRSRVVSARSFGSHRFGSRRFSTSSGLPGIFSNTGVHTPVAAEEEQRDPFASPNPRAGALEAISEAQPLAEPAPSTFKSLPLMMIFQYGLLALHNTTHDQLFMSFLITPYKSGGIGLNPANFSLIIALMCIFQLLYQFYLYPRLGPPLGQFSHLQMFRLGCFLYMPSYLALPLLHSIASPDSTGGFFLMTCESISDRRIVLIAVLTIITALRYCGGTLAYTSVMVLIVS